jgi:hypothetical protein
VKQIVLAAVAVMALGSAAGAQGARSTEKRQVSYVDAWERANAPYKRALYATNLKQAAEGLRFLQDFRARWSGFRAAYDAAPPSPFKKDRRWAADLRDVTAWADSADREIRANRLKPAHDTLELIRIRWMEMRVRNRVPTFGDALTDFHEPMETIVTTLKGSAPEKLSAEALAILRKGLPDVQRTWAGIRRFRTPADEMSKARKARRKTMTDRFGAAVEAYTVAVRAGDRGAIFRNGQRIRPLYAPLYLQFG